MLRSDWDDGRTLGTFHFHSRSLPALKTMHIVPRTPSPEALKRRVIESQEGSDTAPMALHLC